MAQSSANIENHEIIIDLEKKIELLTKGFSSYYNSLFKNLSIENKANAKTLYEFLETERNIQNVKLSTIVTHIKAICLFNEYLSYKDFEKITKEDILYYLSSLRKTESDDPTHKWIGTYNTRQMVLNKFFRWLYNHYQNNESDHEKWITPSYMQGIKQLSRKEKSPYKPSDIWTNEDHALFLKYCPEKRDKCYHAMANDTSCRPHELLSLKLKDIKFKVSSTGRQYAEVHIVESKTKPRTLPLIFSIPYVKDWINSHPMANNANAFLFISLADSNFGDQLSENALYKQYTRSYKKRYFPKLLEDSSIPEAEKSYIKNLLTKPWAPYIQRYTIEENKLKTIEKEKITGKLETGIGLMKSIYDVYYTENEIDIYEIVSKTHLAKKLITPRIQEIEKERLSAEGWKPTLPIEKILSEIFHIIPRISFSYPIY